MNAHCCRGAVSIVMVMVALIGGCAAPALLEIGPNANLFNRDAATAEPRAPGRVALIVEPQAQQMTVELEKRARLHAGAFVEQAVLTAVDDGLLFGVQQFTEQPPANERFSATLVIRDVHFDYDQQLLWFIPIPIPYIGIGSAIVKSEASTRLAFDVALYNAQGQLIWTRNYQDGSGRFVWTDPSSDGEPWRTGIGRLAHEAAWRLSQQVLVDLREWLAAERMKPRSL